MTGLAAPTLTADPSKERAALEMKIRVLIGWPDTAHWMVFVPSVLVGQWAGELDRRQSHCQATAYLHSLDHPRLRPYRKAKIRGFVWCGAAVPSGSKVDVLP